MGVFDKILDLKKFNPLLVGYVNTAVKNNVFGTTIIELDNTIGLTSEVLEALTNSNHLRFRIKGGYDESKIELNKDKTFIMDGKEVKAKAAYVDVVTYNKSELYSIIKKIEELEKEVKESYSDIEKVVLIYELLRKQFSVDYDTNALGKEKRSLRGFVSKKLDCSGFALLLKELLERQNIKCDYVEGILVDENFKMPHAWNIIYIDGKFIAADLANDVMNYKYSQKNNPSFLGEINSFSDSHIPNDKENIQFYKTALTSISNQEILNILKYINEQKNRSNKVFEFTRNDNTKLLLSIIGDEIISDQKLKKIICYEKINDIITNPVILYTDMNIELQNNQLFIDGEVVNNINILDSLLNSTNIRTSVTTSNGYVGTIKKVNGILENSFTPGIKDKISYSQKNFTRSDGSSFVLEQRNLGAINNYEYLIYELHNTEDGLYIKEKHLFTEKDLFSDSRLEMIDVFLSKENIEKKSLNNSGYLGYYDPGEIKTVLKKTIN